MVGHSQSESDVEEEEEEDGMAEIRVAVEHIVSIFRDPLEVKGACLSSLDDELESSPLCRVKSNNYNNHYVHRGDMSLNQYRHLLYGT